MSGFCASAGIVGLTSDGVRRGQLNTSSEINGDACLEWLKLKKQKLAIGAIWSNGKT